MVTNIIDDADNYDSCGGDKATIRGREVRVVLGADKVFYHNALVSYDFESGLRFMAGMRNVFDKALPRLTTLNLGEVDTERNSAFYSQYDWMGRSYFANVRYEF